ncbi:SRPBCC domain-containing protein [Natronobiforma cellulositropha]|uniref:SRPBCC domain-containing protein n=1 Tax=Natronobiforma cellulositropha TaxID=1679076 RepID=UPI0021D576C6|nr:SRPBCC domain-containing protein [Natronobiforma cellulositropha]
MQQLERFVEIDAPPAAVWAVLLAFERYPEWNPFVTSIEGEPVEGSHLRVRIEPPRSRAMTFEPEVVAAEAPRRLAWLGRLGAPFVFDGYHEFRLEPVGESGERTRFLQRETFRGALVPLLLDEEAVRAGFDAMNEALKTRAERRVGVHA